MLNGTLATTERKQRYYIGTLAEWQPNENIDTTCATMLQVYDHLIWRTHTVLKLYGWQIPINCNTLLLNNRSTMVYSNQKCFITIKHLIINYIITSIKQNKCGKSLSTNTHTNATFA